MLTDTEYEADLTVRSFAHMASRLAHAIGSCGPAAVYAQVLVEADKHRSALALVQRDVAEEAETRLRKHAASKAEVTQAVKAAAYTVAHARRAIDRIAASYAPQKLAA